MLILAIETSCDETAISIVKASSGPRFTILAHIVASQENIHAPYGGVVPNLARREHERNLPLVLIRALKKSRLLKPRKLPTNTLDQAKTNQQIEKILAREPGLMPPLEKILQNYHVPKIDLIAVTQGPGLEPALWAGINFSKALSLGWQIPLRPVNHIEGHIISPFARKKQNRHDGGKVRFPLLALIVSGGHTELLLARKWGEYKRLGETRDDAAGEALDKAARLLGFNPASGRSLGKAAAEARRRKLITPVGLPRPMINSLKLDFSFSGLKTALLYAWRKTPVKDRDTALALAGEFENAVVDVLVEKTRRALKQYPARSFILGGGVSASRRLRLALKRLVIKEFLAVSFFLPAPSLTTDNATMIAMAAYVNRRKNPKPNPDFGAESTLSL